MSILRKEKYIFVESNENHNKFWYIEEHDNGMIRTTWGRVGNKEVVSEKMLGSNATKEYDKLVKSKLKKGYTVLNTVDSNNSTNISNITLETVALNDITYDKSNITITNMIKSFCDKNIHNITSNTSIIFDTNTNLFQTPCGIVTAETIVNAGIILDKIADIYLNNGLSSELIKPVEDYCKLIPQKIKGRFEIYKLFPNKEAIKKQYEILDSLSEALTLFEELNSANTNHEKLFNTSIVEVIDNEIINKITKKYERTHQNIHACRNLKVKRIFEIQIDKMNTEYNTLRNNWIKQAKRKNTKQLWHGTKTANIISILKNGFVIPPANAKHCTGRMFGSQGVYLTDQSTKALNYAYGWWSGSRENHCYMFLCDVMCGTQYIPKGSCSSIPTGYDSIFAKAGFSGVQNNEMVVPLNQVNPKYLIEFGE